MNMNSQCLFKGWKRIRMSIQYRLLSLLALLLLLLVLRPVHCGAAIPQAAIDDPLYAKGYLVVTHYPGVYADGSHAATTRSGLQQAIDDAFANRKVVYFPRGTYLIDAQLNCYTWNSGNDPNDKYHALVGSTLGPRPIIKLDSSAKDYNNASSPKAMLELKNYDSAHPTVEKEASGFYDMLRGIDFDCSDSAISNNAGAYGVYCNLAQDSSIEDVRVDATGAYAGFVGLPGRAWGAVNIEVEGGQYGIDTNGTSAAGSIVAGAVFKNQTKSAIRYSGFTPMTLAGFEIVTPSGSTKAALTIESGAMNAQNVNLIDGIITCGGVPSIAVIDNSNGQNFYARNVYVTVKGSSGSHNLLKGGSQIDVGSGTWKRINEYSYCDQSSEGRRSRNLLNGTLSTTARPSTSISSDVSAPPADLVLRHRWASLPSIDDADCWDAANSGITPGNVSSSAFQSMLAAHRKIFLRPGRYSLNGTITLRNDTVLFGAARHLTQITHRTNWDPGSEVPIITTVDDANATTYIGDMVIGYDASDTTHSWFNMLDWKAGANSMVHIGRPFAIGGAQATKARSLLKVSGSGGGRWYFPGCGETGGSSNAGFRIFKAESTTKPLWIYGLNLEHADSDRYAEFANAQNVRIYTIKTEYEWVGDPNPVFCPLITFNNTMNAALFGAGAIRHSAEKDRGCIEVTGGASTDHVLATLISPQNDGGPDPSYTVLDSTAGAGVSYHDCASLFKRNNGITEDDDFLMTHAHIGYADVPAEWTSVDIGHVPASPSGSAGFGSGVYTVRGSGADIWGTADGFQFLHQPISGDCEISARVLTQQNTHANAKAGVMIRETTAAGSKSAQMVIQGAVPANDTSKFLFRATTDGSTANIGTDNNGAPYWVRLKRKGNSFTAYNSADGSNWIQVGSPQSIPMNSSVLIGLCVTSHDDTVLNTATFDNVKIQKNAESSAHSWTLY